jgi:hypothetical protein
MNDVSSKSPSPRSRTTPDTVSSTASTPLLHVIQNQRYIQSFECRVFDDRYELRYSGDMGARQWKGALAKEQVQQWIKALPKKPQNFSTKASKDPRPRDLSIWHLGQDMTDLVLADPSNKLAMEIIQHCRKLANF